MNEKINIYKDTIIGFWDRKTTLQKASIIIGTIVLLLFIIIGSIVLSKPNFVPLYSNLSPQETGQIKATLDTRGIASLIADNGSTIKVPKQQVDNLKVELAAEGIPNSGTIDYSFFGENAGFGMTDNEFNVVKLEAMQSELAGLMKGIEGINDAKVMINIPEQSIFVNETNDLASASIVLNTKPGYKFNQQQINSLYHLVSKSIPNLPTDNIVITNQFFEYFDLENEQNSSIVGNIASQLEIKREIERDIQRQVQQMLGTMIGQDKVIVSVSTDLDFAQENREEDLVTPVDQENMDGIELSVERITETFTGTREQAQGVTGTGDTEVPNYPAGDNTNEGDYERIEERVNNEVNRIRKEIVEAPYKIRDLGIQVMVEPPDPENPQSLPADRVEDITKILNTIVRTSVNKDSTTIELTDEALQDKVVVSVQQFNGKPDVVANTSVVSTIPTWVYIVGGVLLVLIVILLLLVLGKRKKTNQANIEEQPMDHEPRVDTVTDVNVEHENEATIRRKQLEKMARDKPEEFAKLLRTWLADD